MGNGVCLEENPALAGVSLGTDEKGRHVAVQDTDKLTTSTVFRLSRGKVSAGLGWDARMEGPALGSWFPKAREGAEWVTMEHTVSAVRPSSRKVLGPPPNAAPSRR